MPGQILAEAHGIFVLICYLSIINPLVYKDLRINQMIFCKFSAPSELLYLKGVFAKNERGYRRNAKNKRF